MAGTSEGARKAHRTNLKRYGKDWYRVIGSKGGEVETDKGFAMDHELAARAGTMGGRISRRN